MVGSAHRCVRADSSCLAGMTHSWAPLPCIRAIQPVLPRRLPCTAALHSTPQRPSRLCQRRHLPRRGRRTHALRDPSPEPAGAEAAPVKVEPEVLPPEGTCSQASGGAAAALPAAAGPRLAWAPASWRLNRRAAPWTALLGVGGAAFGALAGAPSLEHLCADWPDRTDCWPAGRSG